MIARTAMLSVIVTGFSWGAEEANPGRARADWIASSASARPSQPIHTAIRIRHDEGWHSYWLNPGEAGMPTTVEWKLPPGWKHGGLRFPAPGRFVTGELAGFGYKGTLLLPVTLTPPEDFAGNARLEAVVSWLACGEEGCVPGEAALTLEIAAGDGSAGPHSADILTAIDRLPRPAGEAMRLVVESAGKSLTLTLHAKSPAPLDPAACEVFPLTPDLIDPKTPIRFVKSGESWTATAALGEFAETPVKELTLVLATKGTGSPVEVAWRAPNDD